tara:strand:- start:2481 stop:3662 length:1182 start_codon:yes stop_codon:yes gene_type:complete
MPKKKKYTGEQLGNNFYKSGWQPGYELNTQTGMGELTHVGTDPDYQNKYDEILRDWGFNPDKYEIVGTVRASSWNTQLKGGTVETFFAFKGIVKAKVPGHDKYFQELFKQSKKKIPLVKKVYKGGDTAFLFFMADWQLGKDDYGVTNTINRYDVALQDGVQRIKDLRKIGVQIDEIYIIGLGDLTENCQGFYDSQSFNISLSMIEQYALARSMIMKTVDTFLPLADKIVLAGAPGNHGEMTRNGKGKVITSRLDNSDTMHLQICDEIMYANKERYKSVTVEIPDGFHQTMTIKNIPCAWTHGHMSGGGGNAEAKIENWWKGQMYGFLPAKDAQILITGHYHHFRSKMQGDRTWFQSPSLDKSIEFTARTGNWSHPGVLSFTVNNKGWDNLKIL